MSQNTLTIFASFPTVPLTDCIPNGDGLVAYHMIDQLSKLGHRVHVVTPRAELETPFCDRVSVYEMNAPDDKSRPGALAYMRWSRKVLREICSREQVDLIHELNPVFSFCSLAFRGFGIPIVLGPHSSRWPRMSNGKTPWLRLVREEAKQKVKDLSVARQHKDAEAILLSTVAALNNVATPEEFTGKLFILPPGIDATVFAPGPEIASADPTVLFLANVSARKGIFSLLEAFACLASRMPSARLIVAGDGPDLSEVKRRVALSFFEERVEFLGRVHRADVPELMRRCTVYCLPSLGEPFGMTAIEAMACGKPLVVTCAGGLQHMISKDGGRRVDVGNSLALAAALEELLLDPELCRQMGEHNRRQAEQTYAWPVIAVRLERIYRHVLGYRTGENPDLITKEQIYSYRAMLSKTATPNSPSTPRPASAGVTI